MTKKTWRELEAEGVRRCCATFTSGKRCRRRASAAFESNWCDKCGPVIKAHEDHFKRVSEQMKRRAAR
jgi:hypothetical protein